MAPLAARLHLDGLVLIPAGLFGRRLCPLVERMDEHPGGVTIDASGQLGNVDALAALLPKLFHTSSGTLSSRSI